MTDEQGATGTEWPMAWMPKFLLAFRESANVRESCDAAGISRTQAYKWRSKSARFRNAWDDAAEDAFDLLEKVAWTRAQDSSDMLLWRLLAAARREKFGDKVEVKLDLTAEAARIASEYNLPPEQADNIVSLADRLKQQRTG